MSKTSAAAEVTPPSDGLERKAGSFTLDPACVAQVDRILGTLSERYPDLAREAIETLGAMARRFVAAPLDVEAGKELYRIAHGLKGNAATLGYPLVTTVAGSLCTLLEHEPSPCPRTQRAIAAHADALLLIIDRRLSGDGGVDGRELSRDLAVLVEKLTGRRAA
ncbi:MAG TPA: Hpt domain-containing protein [Stellaceae bacterium]|nr:Hpt domain-containing protein [Stellaceae bacterium]HYC13250.1 Hpt domain-containing protein [Stellaceae bacterium]